MSYYIYLFSPETFEAFTKTDMSVAGVRENQTTIASRLERGDQLVCYITKVSRWIGVLEVGGKSFEDKKPIFSDVDDPFTIRFSTSPKVWLTLEGAIPIHNDVCWNSLSFTKGLPKNSPKWTPMVRTSLKKLKEEDGRFLLQLLLDQKRSPKQYPLSEGDMLKLKVK